MHQKPFSTAGEHRDSALSILHPVMLVGKGAFGLGPVALNLAKEQNILGCDARIWCFDTQDEITWASGQSGLPSGNITGFPLSGPRKLWFSPRMVKAAYGPEGRAFDIVHQHCLWTSCSLATNILRRKQGIPTVIDPQGSLNTWAVNNSRLKKRLALAAYQRENLENASCIHALADSEVEVFRRFGLSNPIAVIPNGVAEDRLHVTGCPERFRHHVGLKTDARILLFLSRITPKKGLPLLIEAIESLGAASSGWVLIIAGADEFNHKAEIKGLLERKKMTADIRFVGPLYDSLKDDAFAAAELFILPSHSEGAPLVVLESLAAGVPVITTTASPWEELNTRHCGWWVDISTEALAGALAEALRLPAEKLAEMGRRGHRVVTENYTWTTSARKTVALYHWLLGASGKPDFVVTG